MTNVKRDGTNGITLLLCPFCGGVANVIDHHNDDGSVSVGCNNDTCLGFSGLGWLYKTEAEAIAAWNARAERTCRIVEASRKYVLSDGTEFYEDGCSECNGYLGDGDNYCPNCGARIEVDA